MNPSPVPVRVETPAATRETVSRQKKLFPLRLKLIVIVVLGIAPFFLLYIASYSGFDLFRNAYVVGFMFIACVGLLYFLLDYAYIQPVKDLLAWMTLVRESEYKSAPVLPVNSQDEFGGMAQELSASLSFLWNSEQRIETLLRHKRDTTSLIEHQLRTPLTSLVWSLSDTSIPEAVRGALTKMEANVRSIVETAQIEEGKYGYVFTDASISDVLKQVLDSFKQQADIKKITIEYKEGDGVPAVRIDKDRLMTAIGNILSNAISYTPQGGHVSVAVEPTRKGAGITIRDSGIGIPKEELPLLFNKMFRGAMARKMKADGSGLGLYVAKNILEAHNAELAIRSDGAHGTEVLFELPAAQVSVV